MHSLYKLKDSLFFFLGNDTEITEKITELHKQKFIDLVKSKQCISNSFLVSGTKEIHVFKRYNMDIGSCNDKKDLFERYYPFLENGFTVEVDGFSIRFEVLDLINSQQLDISPSTCVLLVEVL